MYHRGHLAGHGRAGTMKRKKGGAVQCVRHRLAFLIGSEQAGDLAVGVHVDAHGGGLLGQARHGHDAAALMVITRLWGRQPFPWHR